MILDTQIRGIPVEAILGYERQHNGKFQYVLYRIRYDPKYEEELRGFGDWQEFERMELEAERLLESWGLGE
jgi:hypothetical protein